MPHSTALARCLPLLALLLALACTPSPSPPDVVLVDLDSVRTDHLSHAGYDLPTAASLDGFRKQATFFTAARSTSSASATGTASLLTGLRARSHGVGGSEPRLAPRFETLAERLRRGGWHTAGLSHDPGIGPSTGFDQGFDRFDAAAGRVEDHPDAEAMVAWVREWLASDPPAPFFLYLHPMSAGPPYRVPPDHQSVLLGRPPSRLLPFGGKLMRALTRPGSTRLRSQLGAEQIRSLVEQYDTAVRYTLDCVADVLAMLQTSGHLENAVVVITANHGEELFDHQGFGHGRTLYEEVLRVPLYVKQPGRAGPPTLDVPVSITDVVPTVLELVGLDASGTDGRSLVPLLRGDAAHAADRDFLHEIDAPAHHSYQRALLRGRQKLIEIGRSRTDRLRIFRLFDLVIDPGERHDLSGESPDIVERLRGVLEGTGSRERSAPAGS